MTGKRYIGTDGNGEGEGAMPVGKQDLLMVFVKNPVPGQVKTRLAATAGDRRAVEIYRSLLRHTAEVSAAVPADRQVWYAGPKGSREGWSTPRTAFRLQRGEDLGERMNHAFESAFGEGYRHAVLIGSDCAELTTNHLKEAFKKLRQHDAVIGPAADGGYYLLGLSRPCPFLFEGIEWSTPEVFRRTMDAAAELDVERLPELSDIDTEADWQREQRRRTRKL